MTKTTSHIVIGTTLVLAVGVAAVYMLGEPFAKLLRPNVPLLTEQPTPEAQPVVVSGSMLASLKAKDGVAGTAGVYKIHLATGETNLENDTNDFYAPSLSNDGSRVAVVGNDGDDVGLLFVSDITKQDEASSFAPPSPAIWAGVSDWSSDDAFVVYEALGAIATATDAAIENSFVIVLDPESGDQRIIDSGASPLFAPDDSILYVKSDGIYRQRISGGVPDGEAERLTVFEGFVATRNSQMALSPDGSAIVVTHPESSFVLSYDVFGVNGVTQLSAPRIIEASIAWPVFSPDGMQLAYVSLDTTGDLATANSLDVIDRFTGEVRTIMPLDTYEDTNLAIRQWTK